MKRLPNHDELLEQIGAEFKNGRIIEASLHSVRREVLNGVMMQDADEPGIVIVDPGPATLETAFHELLHRRYPRWGEKRVERTANRVMLGLSSAQRKRWYQKYKQAATRVDVTVVVPE